MAKETRILHRQNELDKLSLIIETTKDSVESLKTIYKGRGKKGSPTHVDQDLLRAIIVFSCAGIDSFQKHAIKNLYEIIFKKTPEGRKYFAERAQKLIKKTEEKFDTKFITEILISGNSRAFLINKIKSDLSNGSLQSFDSLFNTLAAFGIDSKKVVSSPEEIKNLFEVRNQIIHEMDLDINSFKQGKKKRVLRKQKEIFESSQIAIESMKNFYKQIELIIK